MIVKPLDFQGEISIGQITQVDVQATVQLFIDEYEPVYLADMLGSDLASQLIEGLENPVPEEKWIKLSDIVRLPCAEFIYYWYQRSNFTQTVGVGEVISQTDNATRGASTDKMILIWNKMVRISRDILCRMDTSVYPAFSPNSHSDIFKFINQFGI